MERSLVMLFAESPSPKPRPVKVISLPVSGSLSRTSPGVTCTVTGAPLRARSMVSNLAEAALNDILDVVEALDLRAIDPDDGVAGAMPARAAGDSANTLPTIGGMTGFPEIA